MNKDLLIEVIGDSLIIALAIVLLVLGVILQVHFTVYAGQEPNPVILISEIVMSILILSLGINRLVNEKTTDFMEISGDIILILGGFILTGMFLTIFFKNQFLMYQVEPIFLITRLVLSALIGTVGINRFIDDIRSGKRN
uniref:Uncharacterized protein n=1 Tax=viral metagenome TaxID=1070528 RepID=A0A6M3JUB3_9ZZZZ